MEIFNIEKLLKDSQNQQIYEFHLVEGQLPFVRTNVGPAAHQITPLKQYEKLSHTVCIDTIQSLEKSFDIKIDEDLFMLTKDGIKLCIVSEKYAEKISITLRKSIYKTNWI